MKQVGTILVNSGQIAVVDRAGVRRLPVAVPAGHEVTLGLAARARSGASLDGSVAAFILDRALPGRRFALGGCDGGRAVDAPVVLVVGPADFTGGPALGLGPVTGCSAV